jgi:hypothetical protein
MNSRLTATCGLKLGLATVLAEEPPGIGNSR